MNDYIHKQYRDLKNISRQQADNYKHAIPFPHIVFNDFFDTNILEKVLAEFPDLLMTDSVSFNNHNEKKYATKGERSFGPNTKSFMHFLNSEPFLKFIQKITSINETLISDPYFLGGGLHEIKRGGLLKVHADFNKHHTTNLDRRINVLIYLNKEWKPEYGGHLELWDTDMKICQKRILPKFNTIVIFTTTDYSYHGHPDPVTCPDNMSRKSLALYYFSNGRPKSEINPRLSEHCTLFQARVGNKNDRIDFV